MAARYECMDIKHGNMFGFVKKGTNLGIKLLWDAIFLRLKHTYYLLLADIVYGT
jgi:hypothetical protein